MAIEKQKVTLEGNEFYKIWSNAGKKIQCDQDGALYNLVYITLGSNNTFTETKLDVSDVKYISSGQIYDLGESVLNIISSNNQFVEDVLDGARNNQFDLDAGGAD